MGQYQFREQLTNRGCYCGISLRAKYVESENHDLTINYNADIKWKPSCIAGIHIFFDYFNKLKFGKLEVSIDTIQWLPVDTNHLTVLYSVIFSLSKELKITIPDVQLDKERELFTFPEPRILLKNKWPSSLLPY